MPARLILTESFFGTDTCLFRPVSILISTVISQPIQAYSPRPLALAELAHFAPFFLLGCQHMQLGQAIGFTRLAITADICKSAKISSPHSPHHTSSFFSFLFHFLSFLLSQPAHTTRPANSIQLSTLTVLSFSISFCSFFFLLFWTHPLAGSLSGALGSMGHGRHGGQPGAAGWAGYGRRLPTRRRPARAA